MLYAIQKGQPEIAVLLLNAGADPNVREIEGRTALIIAASGGGPRSGSRIAGEGR